MTMSHIARTVLLCGLGAGAGLFAYRTLIGDAEQTHAADPVQYAQVLSDRQAPSPPPVELHSASEQDAQRSPLSLELTATSAKATQDPELMKLGEVPAHLEPWKFEPQPIPTHPSVFEDKYRDYGLEELQEASKQVGAKFAGQAFAGFRERHQAGLSFYREFDMMRDEDHDGKPDDGAGFGISGTARDVLTGGGTDYVGGEMKPYVVWLPADQYPEVYALRDESNWLRAREGKLLASSSK